MGFVYGILFCVSCCDGKAGSVYTVVFFVGME
jgi:hypothetical protein